MADIMMPKILLVEDEPALAEIIKESLIAKDFDVYLASTIGSAWALTQEHSFNLFILDVMLPDGDGYSLLKRIRMRDANTPALFLTAKSQATDVVSGFESGANDYLKKPFSMEELVIRMKSLLGILHRPPIDTFSQTGSYAIGEYSLQYPEGLLIFKGTKKQLTYREAELLRHLQVNHEQMVFRRDLLLKYWGNDDYFSGRSLDVFITKLRRYLKNDPSIAILNFRGQGYKLIY